MGLLLAFFLLSIIVSFLCSILEAVLLSITPAFVAVQEQSNSAISPRLARFKADIDRPLAAILTLNTIAHTVGAIGVGAQAGAVFGSGSLTLFGVSIISWEAFVAGAMTLAILIFSEVIPKTLGANNWERLVPFTVRTLSVMLFLLAPLIWLSQLITSNLKKDKSKSILTRTDFMAMAELGNESGALKNREHTIISNLLRFNRIRVKDIMTPRIVVLTADANQSMKDFHSNNADLPFSRIPLYSDQNENIVGYMLKDELLLNLVKDNGDNNLGSIKRDIVVVHATLALPELLNIMIAKKEHLALVVDEFGGMEGLATMEDIIETLLGLEIVDESDSSEDMQVLARKNWELRAKKMGITPPES